MSDNTTPHSAKDYDKKINETIPYMQEFYMQSIDMITQIGYGEGKWLDLGCGTGIFEEIILKKFPDMKMTAVDPSEQMLNQAKQKLNNAAIQYACCKSTDISYVNEYNVITAIQSHHYMQEAEREQATKNVYRALKAGGVYISFENVIPEDDDMKQLELLRWGRYQVSQGKSKEEALEHNKRCGVNYFPLTVEVHISLLKKAGFKSVYVFWKSYMQMGICGIK